jgi:hypothetical protein
MLLFFFVAHAVVDPCFDVRDETAAGLDRDPRKIGRHPPDTTSTNAQEDPR